MLSALPINAASLLFNFPNGPNHFYEEGPGGAGPPGHGCPLEQQERAVEHQAQRHCAKRSVPNHEGVSFSSSTPELDSSDSIKKRGEGRGAQRTAEKKMEQSEPGARLFGLHDEWQCAKSTYII